MNLYLAGFSGPDLAKRPLESLVDILLARLKDVAGLFVFDNVDHLVNLMSGRLTSAADLLLRRFLELESDCQIVFTCRPEIWHPSTLSLRLQGLSLEASMELFQSRKARASAEEIREAHDLTDGHAFWLDLLALQLVRKDGLQLASIVNEIRTGQGPLPDLTLQSVWSKLNERETLVLRAMAETLRPESEEEIAGFLSRQLTYNKVNRAMRALRQLNLVVVKRSTDGVDLHELHPLVRQFVLMRSSGRQRRTMIEAIIDVYNRFRGVHRHELGGRASITLLQHWTQACELAVGASNYQEAFECLAEARSAFESSAFLREYVRAARIALTASNWVQEHPSYKDFDSIFRTHVRFLAHLGLNDEADGLLDSFSLTVMETDSRYIQYCEMRAHSHWLRDDFQEAIRWGEIGDELASRSGVDTEHSSEVKHILALAWRDAGSPEKALPSFLQSRSLSEVLDTEEFDENLGGAYYGNIGRCLHFMGQSRDALICYQKSALLIEKRIEREHAVNQGYIRQWIGELLLSRDQRELAVYFLEAAQKKWNDLFPVRARRLSELLRQILPAEADPHQKREQREPEAVCIDWIKGRNLDRLLD